MDSGFAKQVSLFLSPIFQLEIQLMNNSSATQDHILIFLQIIFKEEGSETRNATSCFMLQAVVLLKLL